MDKAIIKANAMIVTDIKLAKSNFIIKSKVISTIRLTSLVGGKPHLHILISYKRIIPKYGNTSQYKMTN